MEEIKEEVMQEQSEDVAYSGEDMLLVQIDAFRDKAKQLQSLIAAKERRVHDLEREVLAKENRNLELQAELTRKQEAADGLAADVETQVDRMLQKLSVGMDDLEDHVKEQVANNQESAEQQTKALKETLEEMSGGLGEIRGELSEKVHSENVKQYRNIQDLLKEMDDSEQRMAQMVSQFRSVKNRLTVAILLGIVNLGGLVCLFLTMLGILKI